MPEEQTPPKLKENRRIPKKYRGIFIALFIILAAILTPILVFRFITGDRNFLNQAQNYANQTQQALAANATKTPWSNKENDPGNLTSSIDNDKQNEKKITPTIIVGEKPEDQVNILLLGSDERPDGGGFRTDIIVWLSLNPEEGFVSAISFPRDLFVMIPGRGENRINTAFPAGGFELLADTFELNFGIRPDHYILIDLQGFVALINSLDGIDVDVSKNLTDRCDIVHNNSGICSVGPGLEHMDGDMALWFARSRYSTNDIERTRRAQEVLEAIFDRMMSLDVIFMVKEVYDICDKFVQTDVSLEQTKALIPLAKLMDKDRDVRNYVVGFDLVTSQMTNQGAYVLIPDINGIRNLMIEALTLK